MTQHDLSGVPHLRDGQAFTTREALLVGLTPRMLDHPRFSRCHHGVRKVLLPQHSVGPEQRAPETLHREQAEDYRARLRVGEAFSHGTALILHGCPIRAPRTIHVTIPAPARATRSSGVRGHSTARPFAYTSVGELPVTPPVLSLAQAAAVLPFRELVVAIDHLLAVDAWNTQGAGNFASQLTTCLGQNTRSGAERLRYAATYARLGAESRMETLTRLLMAEYGIDRCSLQVELSDAKGWIGRFDMVDEVSRKIIEFDGEQHRTDRQQYLRDLRRLDRVRDAGYGVLRVHREDLRQSQAGQTAARIARFLGVRPCHVSGKTARYFSEPSGRA